MNRRPLFRARGSSTDCKGDGGQTAHTNMRYLGLHQNKIRHIPLVPSYVPALSHKDIDVLQVFYMTNNAGALFASGGPNNGVTMHSVSGHGHGRIALDFGSGF